MTTLTEALEIAAQYHRHRKFDRACQVYKQILSQRPNQPDALCGLGILAQEAGETQSAKALLRKAIASEPESAKAWFGLGNLLQAEGQLPEATQCYQRILALGVDSAAVRNNLGDTWQQQGKWEDAVAQYQKALELDPHCIEAEVSLGNALHEVGLLPPEKYDRCARLNYEVGWMRHKAGDDSTALEYYQKAIALAPNWVAAHYRLGNALAAQNQREEALGCYRNLLDNLLETTASQPEISKICARLARIRADSIERQLQKAQKPDRLKIAFICQPSVMTTFPNPTDSLGILTYEFARLLVRDCDVTVYVPGREFQEVRYEDILFRYISIEEDLDPIEAIEEPTIADNSQTPLVASSTYFLSYISRVARQLQIDRVDIAHVWTFSQFAPILKSSNPELKVVLHLEDELLVKLDKSLVEKRLQFIDLVIGCSHYITDKIKNKFPQFSSRFQTVYNGANVDRFIQLYSPSQPQRNQNQKQRLLFIGRISPEKGSHILLEAFAKVLDRYPETELHLIGPTGVIPHEFGIGGSDDPLVLELEKFHRDGAWKAYLNGYLTQQQKSGKEGREESIFCHGLLKQSQLVDYYHASDIFIFPSVWHEPFGMPIVEAMVAGVPVIATWGGAFPEPIEDGITGLLVERGNVDALAAAIERLLEDEELRSSIARTARDRALDRFSFETVTDELLHQYQQLSNDPQPDDRKTASVGII